MEEQLFRTDSTLANYAARCFPARNLLKVRNNSDGGAWLFAYKEEQKRRFKAVLCPDQHPGKKKDKKSTRHSSKFRKTCTGESEEKLCPELNGIWLLKELHVDDPSDLASLNISGRNLHVKNHEDFVLFDNVEHIDASENNLQFASSRGTWSKSIVSLLLDIFRTFPVLRDLELQLNNISYIDLAQDDFPYLENLDLSYNEISRADILLLGILPRLKKLYLTGNGLTKLPVQMARTYNVHEGSNQDILVKKRRFPMLEELYLDENELSDISTFASLAGLQKLKKLNLSKNRIDSVPQLRLMITQNTGNENNNVIHHSPPSKNDLTERLNNSDRQVNPNNSYEATDNLELERDGDIDNGDLEINQLNIDENLLNTDFSKDFNLGESLEDDDEDITEEKQNNMNTTSSGNLLLNCSSESDPFSNEPKQPFQSLEHLILTDNEIKEEGALLSLAIWPSLKEVDIWGNPLTKILKNDPPILIYHLTKLCGIKINRKEAKTVKKPLVGPAITPAVKYNKVKEIVPPKRKKNLLMLEFSSGGDGDFLGNSKPLPPIKSANENGDIDPPRYANTAPTRTEKNETMLLQEDPTLSHRPYSVARDHFFTKSSDDIRGRNSKEELEMELGDELTDGVFLTQVDGVDDSDLFDRTEQSPQKKRKERKPSYDLFRHQSLEEKKYKGFEEILQIDPSYEPDDIPPVEDVRGNITALKHALNNPLVFNEPDEADYRKRTYTKRKKTSSLPPTRKTKADQLARALENMRTQPTAIEESLDNVLNNYENDPKIRRQFPEVKRLLKEVQSKYDEVRMTSLESASVAQKLLQHPRKNSNPQTISSLLGRQKITGTSTMDANPKSSRSVQKAASMKLTSDSSVDLFKTSKNPERTMEDFKKLVDSRI